MKVVLVRFKDGERREFPLKGRTTVVGRRPDCALRIASGQVSRQHCEIVVKDDGVWVKDLGSSNGTYVKGKRVAEAKLAAGDHLTVGPVVFVVQIDGRPARITPVDAQVAGSAAPQAAPAEEEEEVLDLGAEDLDLDDVISSLDELDEEAEGRDRLGPTRP